MKIINLIYRLNMKINENWMHYITLYFICSILFILFSKLILDGNILFIIASLLIGVIIGIFIFINILGYILISKIKNIKQ